MHLRLQSEVDKRNWGGISFLILQGRVLFFAYFTIIVLGLAFMRRCHPSSYQGMCKTTTPNLGVGWGGYRQRLWKSKRMLLLNEGWFITIVQRTLLKSHLFVWISCYLFIGQIFSFVIVKKLATRCDAIFFDKRGEKKKLTSIFVQWRTLSNKAGADE